jgi:ribonuclease HI
MTSKDEKKPNWVRMRFKNSKVWVEADAAGLPLARDGRIRIKYQLDQTQDYRVRLENLRPLDAPAEPQRAPAHRPVSRQVPEAQEDQAQGVVHIFTDGASSGNPGPSGIGVVLLYGAQRKELSEYIGQATNNIAELLAIQKGLGAVKSRRLPVRLYTDSSYAYGVLVSNWKPKKNLELIAAIRKSLAAFTDLRLIKVRGHEGVKENERADELATSAIRNALR